MSRGNVRGLVPGALAALAAALAGAVVWGLVVKVWEYEVGVVAWGIGFVAGTAAALVARERRGVALQAAAVVASLVGILVGKYLGYAWAAQEAGERFGLDVVGLHSTAMMRAFRTDLDLVFGWFDLLWAGLAVFTAWRATAPEAVVPPATETVAGKAPPGSPNETVR